MDKKTKENIVWGVVGFSILFGLFYWMLIVAGS